MKSDSVRQGKACGTITVTYGNDGQGEITLRGEIFQVESGALRVYLDGNDVSDFFPRKELERRFGGLCAGECVGDKCPSNFVEADAILG